MAKQVSEAVAAAMATQVQRMNYPWEKWANGKWWHLEQGIDFYVDPSSFRTTAKNWGSKNGYIADARVTDDKKGIVICFSPE